MHRHPKLWENPQQFYPERFLNDSPLKHKFSYIPFGSGPRLCIGMQFAIMEMTLLLSDIVRNFEWKLIENHQEVKPLPLVTLKPSPYIKVRIKKL
jgi:cytochrome P450